MEHKSHKTAKNVLKCYEIEKKKHRKNVKQIELLDSHRIFLSSRDEMLDIQLSCAPEHILIYIYIW